MTGRDSDEETLSSVSSISSVSSVSSLSDSEERACVSALLGLKEEMATLNSTLRQRLATDKFRYCRLGQVALKAANTPSDADSEVLKSAVDLLQEKEDYLDHDSFIAMVDLFSTETLQAHIYLSIKRDSLRRRWVKRELEKAGRRIPDFTPHSEVQPDAVTQG